MTVPIPGTGEIQVLVDAASREHDHSIEVHRRGLPQHVKEAILQIMRRDMALKPASVTMEVRKA